MSRQGWAPPREVVTQAWLETELNAEAAANVAREERTHFDKLAGGSGAELVLFGAGNLGRRTLNGLRRAGIEPIGFVDNSPALQGTVVDGVTVSSPAEAVKEYGRRATFVISAWSPSRPHVFTPISQMLLGLGAHRVIPFVPLFWKYADEFLPYHCLDLPHRLYVDGESVREAYGKFDDRRSREQFRLQLSYLLSAMDVVDVPRGQPAASYFPKGLVALSPREVFVDCGAYDGDTLETFLEAVGGRFEEVVAFEPDPHAVAQLRMRVEGLEPQVRARIRIEPNAVGAAAGLLHFEGGGTPGSRLSEAGALTVECVTLDSALRDSAPTFIKMDIEGAEGDALLGAAGTIQTHRPILAICVYHLQADLYRLPTLIARLCSDYSLFLRRQGPDGDLVCYAIPNERLRSQ